MSKEMILIAFLMLFGFPAVNHARADGESCLLYPVKVIRNGTRFGGYIDRTGRTVVEPVFSEVKPFRDGMAVAKTDNPDRISLINCKGEIIPVEGAELVEDFSEGLAFVRMMNKSGFINRKAEMVITLPQELKLDWDAPLAFGFKNGRAGLNGVHGVYHVDRMGNLAPRTGVLSSQGLSGKVESVQLKEGYTLLDEKGRRLVPFENAPYQFSENDGYFLVHSQDGKWRYFDGNGTEKLSITYTHAGPINHGLAPVLSSTNGKYGYINEIGQLVIPTKFDGASEFEANGLAAAALNNRVGIIDTRGSFVIEPVFAEVGEFIGDLIWVRESCGEAKGAWGYVDHKGKWLWKDNSSSCDSTLPRNKGH